MTMPRKTLAPLPLVQCTGGESARGTAEEGRNIKCEDEGRKKLILYAILRHTYSDITNTKAPGCIFRLNDASHPIDLFLTACSYHPRMRSSVLPLSITCRYAYIMMPVL